MVTLASVSLSITHTDTTLEATDFVAISGRDAVIDVVGHTLGQEVTHSGTSHSNAQPRELTLLCRHPSGCHRHGLGTKDLPGCRLRL